MEELKNQTEIVKQPISKLFNKTDNIIAFRANDREEHLINSLKRDWQLTRNSEVLHRVLGSFAGYMAERAERIAEIKALMHKWQIKTFELTN